MHARKNQDSFMQNLLDGVDSKLELKTKHESDLNRGFLSVFAHAEPIGIAPGYSKHGDLIALAIADDTYCLIVQFYSNRSSSRRGAAHNDPPRQRESSGRLLLEEIILCRDLGDLYGFDMGPLSMSIFVSLDLRITSGVDIQSAFSAVDRKPISAIRAAIGDTIRIFDDNVIDVFEKAIYDEKDTHCASDLAMRAWISQYLVRIGNGAETFQKVAKINTKNLPQQTLKFLAKMTQDSLRLTHMKSSETKHSFTATHNPDGLGVKSGAYKDKLRPSKTLVMSVRNANGQSYTVHGRSGGVDGRSTNLDLSHSLDTSKTILQIRSIGRDDPTTAEAQRAAAVLQILQGKSELLSDNPWLKNIWFPALSDEACDSELLVWPPEWTVLCEKGVPSFAPSSDNIERHNLNKSQQEAVDTMLSRADTHRITIIQGPPGTGKTSVIANYVQAAMQGHEAGIWLVAKSNVAVINIALKLMSVGFTNWKLLASGEFAHTDWHGHLYTSVQDHFINSNEFQKMSVNRIKGCKVILCTLSMLSNRWINLKFTNQVPVTTIVVDEASQIEIGDYIPVFNNFHSTLRKICFIGDDKQLPPFGQEDLQDLQSIFEIPHLRRLCLFLDTQYRMPPQIGAFISENVYDNKLKSNPKHPISDQTIACYFVNVIGSKEQATIGTSIQNKMECDAIIKLAQHLQTHDKSYKIITPYDAQRVLIEDALKNTDGMHWEEKVYNVDSFQGNEEDYIVISLTRTFALGFLTNLRRTNVMLTRCKKGMIIVSSKAFLCEGPGKNCIVGKLSKYVGEQGWLDMKDVDSGEFLTSPQKRVMQGDA